MRYAPVVAAVLFTVVCPSPDIHAADDSPAMPAPRVRIYQLFVRLFGNTNATCKHSGTLAENGVGKFADINAAALKLLRKMGFTRL